MTQEIEVTEEIKTGELTVQALAIQKYKIVGFDESIVPVNRIAELKEKFVPMLQTFETHNQNRADILKEFEQYKKSGEAAPKALLDRAFRHRNDIAKIRTTTENARKSCNEDLNKAKSGNDALANYIKENISSDESAMKAIEAHNEKIETARLKVIQDERAKIAAEHGLTEETDFSGMAQTVFDSIIAGLKATRKEEEEAKLKSDLRISRQTECLNLSEFIEHYDAIDLAEMSEEAYSSLKVGAGQKKHDHEEAVKAEKETERLAKIEADRMQEETRLENEQLKADAEEAEKIETARIKSEEKAQKKRDDEKDESDRLARLQALSQQRSDDQAAQAIKDKELAEQRERDAKAETGRLEQEKIEAEEKRIADVKSMTKSCSQITVEQLERAHDEGKTVFVKVVSIEFIEGQAGIFIQSSDS
jgi:hypothetical protein